MNRWSTWKRLGVWPFAGGAAEQPATVIEEFNAIEAALDEKKRDDADAEQRRREQESKKPKTPKRR